MAILRYWENPILPEMLLPARAGGALLVAHTHISGISVSTLQHLSKGECIMREDTNAVVPFFYEGREVRVILDEENAPWWVAKDVCGVLGIEWKGAGETGSLAALDEDEKGISKTDTLGGPQTIAIISEPGLYKLIFRSNKPEAKKFTRWVTHEVLPQIRKTGRYEASSVRDILSDPALMYRAVVKMLEKQGEIIADIANKQRLIQAGIVGMDLPLRVFNHPKGPVRLFLVRQSPMLLGRDFLDILSDITKIRHGNYSYELAGLGFGKGRDFVTVSCSELGAAYGCAPAYIAHCAGLNPNAKVFSFITPKGMGVVADIAPEFYAWYREHVAPSVTELLEIYAGIEDAQEVES